MCICSDSGKTGNYKFSVVALGKLDAQKYIVNRDGYIYDARSSTADCISSAVPPREMITS